MYVYQIVHTSAHVHKYMRNPIRYDISRMPLKNTLYQYIIENIPIACKLQDARHRIQNTKNNIQNNTNMCMKVHSYQMKHNRAADICMC